MKVYTEVVYTWDDAKNELVEESSKSFDYEGEVTQCLRIGGSLGAAISNVKRTVITPAQKAANKAASAKMMKRFKKNIADMKIKFGKPKIVEKIQKTAAGGAKQLKTNLESAASTTKSNVHGVTTAARTGLHEGTSAARAGLHAATDAGRAELHRGADTLKGIWDQVRGKGGGGKEETGGGGTGANVAAMGSTGSTSEKSGKFGSKGQLSTAKRKRGNRGKEGLKVRVA